MMEWLVLVYQDVIIKLRKLLFYAKNLLGYSPYMIQCTVRSDRRGFMGILIVDDAAFMRRFIAAIFEQHNIEVVGEASNGAEAVKQYRSLTPQLVTMDISMPEMGGIEAIKRILEIDPAARIIVCSVMGYEDTILDALKAGARSYILKPINAEKLISETRRLIGRDKLHKLNS